MKLKTGLTLILGALVYLSLNGCAPALVAGGAAGGYAAAQNKDVRDYTDDAWITSKVKSKLAANAGLKTLGVSVSTNNNVVSLTGETKTQAQRQRVIDVAWSVKGVKGVNASNLTVGD